MNHHRRAGFVIPLILCAAPALAEVPPPVVTSGGGSASGTNVRVYTSIGQPMASEMGIGIWYVVSAMNDGPVSDVPAMAPVNKLGQNAPNPFNPSTTIAFSLAESGKVRLGLYNLKGAMVAELLDREMPAGEHSLVFRPTRLPSGVYFYRLETGSFSQTRRLMLLK